MDVKETGLRHRLRRARRQIATQHAHLRSAHQSVAEAAEAADPRAVVACVDRLRGVIDAHFSLEEEVFFPAIHGLHPESVAAIDALEAEHRTYRSDLDRLRQVLTGRSLEEFVSEYRGFAAATAEHEAREERLLASLSHLFEGDA